MLRGIIGDEEMLRDGSILNYLKEKVIKDNCVLSLDNYMDYLLDVHKVYPLCIIFTTEEYSLQLIYIGCSNPNCAINKLISGIAFKNSKGELFRLLCNNTSNLECNFVFFTSVDELINILNR